MFFGLRTRIKSLEEEIKYLKMATNTITIWDRERLSYRSLNTTDVIDQLCEHLNVKIVYHPGTLANITLESKTKCNDGVKSE